MGYPQYPGYQPNPVNYQPYPGAQQAAPSGGTAITAGVLASVGALVQSLGGALNIVIGVVGFDSVFDATGNGHADWFRRLGLVTGVLGVLAGGSLSVGAIGLFRRWGRSRMLIFAGCVITIASGITSIVVTGVEGSAFRESVAYSGGIGPAIGLVFPIVTLALVLAPATARWLEARPQSGYPYPAPGYSGYDVAPGLYPVAPGQYPVAPAQYPFAPAQYSAPPAQYPAPPMPPVAPPVQVAWADDVPPRPES